MKINKIFLIIPFLVCFAKPAISGPFSQDSYDPNGEQITEDDTDPSDNDFDQDTESQVPVPEVPPPLILSPSASSDMLVPPPMLPKGSRKQETNQPLEKDCLSTLYLKYIDFEDYIKRWECYTSHAKKHFRGSEGSDSSFIKSVAKYNNEIHKIKNEARLTGEHQKNLAEFYKDVAVNYSNVIPKTNHLLLGAAQAYARSAEMYAEELKKHELSHPAVGEAYNHLANTHRILLEAYKTSFPQAQVGIINSDHLPHEQELGTKSSNVGTAEKKGVLKKPKAKDSNILINEKDSDPFLESLPSSTSKVIPISKKDSSNSPGTKTSGKKGKKKKGSKQPLIIENPEETPHLEQISSEVLERPTNSNQDGVVSPSTPNNMSALSQKDLSITPGIETSGGQEKKVGSKLPLTIKNPAVTANIGSNSGEVSEAPTNSNQDGVVSPSTPNNMSALSQKDLSITPGIEISGEQEKKVGRTPPLTIENPAVTTNLGSNSGEVSEAPTNSTQNGVSPPSTPNNMSALSHQPPAGSGEHGPSTVTKLEEQSKKSGNFFLKRSKSLSTHQPENSENLKLRALIEKQRQEIIEYEKKHNKVTEAQPNGRLSLLNDIDDPNEKTDLDGLKSHLRRLENVKSRLYKLDHKSPRDPVIDNKATSSQALITENPAVTANIGQNSGEVSENPTNSAQDGVVSPSTPNNMSALSQKDLSITPGIETSGGQEKKVGTTPPLTIENPAVTTNLGSNSGEVSEAPTNSNQDGVVSPSTPNNMSALSQKDLSITPGIETSGEQEKKVGNTPPLTIENPAVTTNLGSNSGEVSEAPTNSTQNGVSPPATPKNMSALPHQPPAGSGEHGPSTVTKLEEQSKKSGNFFLKRSKSLSTHQPENSENLKLRALIEKQRQEIIEYEKKHNKVTEAQPNGRLSLLNDIDDPNEKTDLDGLKSHLRRLENVKSRLYKLDHKSPRDPVIDNKATSNPNPPASNADYGKTIDVPYIPKFNERIESIENIVEKVKKVLMEIEKKLERKSEATKEHGDQKQKRLNTLFSFLTFYKKDLIKMDENLDKIRSQFSEINKEIIDQERLQIQERIQKIKEEISKTSQSLEIELKEIDSLRNTINETVSSTLGQRERDSSCSRVSPVLSTFTKNFVDNVFDVAKMNVLKRP